MLLIDRHYFKPSKDARVLAILDALTRDNSISQVELGRQMNLSGAMVNQYLKELHDTDMVRFEAVNGKSYRYLLTDQGERRRRQLFSAYSSETIQIYTALKNAILGKLDPLLEKGLLKLALFGASETCEVTLSALRDTPFQILTLLDNDPAKQGSMFHGYVIAPPDVLDTIACQAVVITSFGGQEEIYQQLAPIGHSKGLEIVKL
ncbi:MAG: winged helix-turn-helix transcriptional regulator [Desulfovibrio sp.]|nr:MAG: winged helix-turn-helix transcriptional regulator [Desulfovibrio sp.]